MVRLPAQQEATLELIRGLNQANPAAADAEREPRIEAHDRAF
jgi:hypothetical protein